MMQHLIALAALFTTKRDERDERGATAVEYGLMVVLIGMAIVVTVTTLGTELDGVFTDVKDKLAGTSGS